MGKTATALYEKLKAKGEVKNLKISGETHYTIKRVYPHRKYSADIVIHWIAEYLTTISDSKNKSILNCILRDKKSLRATGEILNMSHMAVSNRYKHLLVKISAQLNFRFYNET